jgi:hypothetical protein
MSGILLPLLLSIAVAIAAWSLGRAHGSAERAAETAARDASEPVPVAITNVYEFAAACVAAVEAWGVAQPPAKTRGSPRQAGHN